MANVDPWTVRGLTQAALEGLLSCSNTANDDHKAIARKAVAIAEETAALLEEKYPSPTPEPYCAGTPAEATAPAGAKPEAAEVVANAGESGEQGVVVVPAEASEVASPAPAGASEEKPAE